MCNIVSRETVIKSQCSNSANVSRLMAMIVKGEAFLKKERDL